MESTSSLHITIGADPEFFVTDPHGNLRSAIGLVGGSKDQPKSLGRSGFFVQEDNVAVEFNVPPAKTVSEFVDGIDWSIQKLTIQLSQKHLVPKFSASEIFPAAEINRDIRALMFGCDPDYNARTLDQNPRPQAEIYLRSCGGHVHVGYDPVDRIPRHSVIKMMDLYLGIPAVMMDMDTRRRKLYGQAGAFRPTNYGVEYRVLSNFWLNTKALTRWVYNQTHRAIYETLKYPGKVVEFFEKDGLGKMVQKAINKSDLDLCSRLIEEHKLVVV